ncbi:MAG: hypothetical protein J6X84_06035 [Treponema sp.]|nr:hypothetical protein [Treponema sp.]
MKKLLAFTAAAVMAAGLFALDLGGIKGTWQDKNWDADWTFAADGKIILKKSSNGEEIFTFTEDNIQNFKVKADTKGVSISFDCKETERSYKFTKGVSLNSDLDMHIDPKWTTQDYDTSIKFKN